jgi:hypothetical protein
MSCLIVGQRATVREQLCNSLVQPEFQGFTFRSTPITSANDGANTSAFIVLTQRTTDNFLVARHAGTIAFSGVAQAAGFRSDANGFDTGEAAQDGHRRNDRSQQRMFGPYANRSGEAQVLSRSIEPRSEPFRK